MTLHQFLLIGYQVFATAFVLGVATIILEAEEDDDDNDGGTLIPCYQSNQ